MCVSFCVNMLNMYVDFYMLPLLLPSGFVCFYFGTIIWSPRLRSSVTQTWEVSSMKPFTMPHPTLITPRNLLMLASSIAPYPSKYSGSLRLHHHSRAQRAAAFRRPPCGLVAMLHPNDGYEWTLGLEKMGPSMFL